MRIDVDIAYSYRVIVVKVLVTVVVMVYVVSHSSSFRCVYMPAKHYILLKREWVKIIKCLKWIGPPSCKLVYESKSK